jgi:GNAT superfamily N-acetyltransferase
VRACDCFCLGTAMGEGEYRSGGAIIRAMRPEDIGAADAVAWSVLGHHRATRDPEERRLRAQARFEHYLEVDPAGAWVAELDGRIVGTAIAILREGIWGLGLLAVAAEHQARGLGRVLLEAALTYADGARGGLIMSSEDPRALRRYALAGFGLRPCVAAAGMLRTDLPAVPAGVHEPDRAAAVAFAAPISRAVRGASHGEDLGLLVDAGARFLALGNRGYALHEEGTVRVLAARDDETAAALLTACFAQAPRGATVQVDLLTHGQDWAIRTCLLAGLSLSPAGAVFTRGDVGPMRPYIPTGPFL